MEADGCRVDQDLLRADNKMVVVCKDVGKHFHVGKETLPVLEGLNLSIPQGTIFSLLGPSGCGKTTLLKCIVGRTMIDEGILRVFGMDPRSKKSGLPGPKIGYMPQVIALTEYLTVTETLLLFGKLFGMNTKKIEKRSQILLDVLEMSIHCKKLIKKLSVGQQRRVSFAVALLNESPLLILDEPTVGVDPMLRKSIWNYLTNFVKRSNTTVIITTHYIEEARKSHSVGLLLYGNLLAHSSPDELIAQHNCPTLEDVFLKLCITKLHRKNEDGEEQEIAEEETKVAIRINGENKTNGFDDAADPTETSVKRKKCKCGNALVKMKRKFRGGFWESIKLRRLSALFQKNVKDMLRFTIGLISLLILPAFSMLAFPMTIGNQLSNVPVGVVNDDGEGLGSLYLSALNKEIITQVNYTNYSLAAIDAKLGRICGILWLKTNFTDALIDRFSHGILADNHSFINGNLFVALDYDNYPIAVSIYFEVMNCLERFVEGILVRVGLNPQLGQVPVQHLTDVYGGVHYDFQRYVAPTFLLILVSLFVMAVTSILTMIKREEGHFDRFYTSGVTSIELLLAEAFSQMVFMIPQISLILIVMFVVNGFTNQGSFILVILMVILQYMCGLSLGFLIIGISPDLVTSMVIMVTIFLFIVLTQGLFWPLEGMPYALRQMCQLGYFALPGQAMRDIMNHGWGITHTIVISGFAVTIVWTVLFFFFGWLSYRLRS